MEYFFPKNFIPIFINNCLIDIYKTILNEIINKIINESWNIFFREILFPFLLIIILIDILD